MAAEDFYHDTVRIALIKDGWTITDDPFSLKVGKRALFIPERILYLAIRDEIYLNFFSEEIAQIVLETQRLKLLVFDVIEEVIVQWLN